MCTKIHRLNYIFSLKVVFYLTISCYCEYAIRKIIILIWSGSNSLNCLLILSIYPDIQINIVVQIFFKRNISLLLALIRSFKMESRRKEKWQSIVKNRRIKLLHDKISRVVFDNNMWKKKSHIAKINGFFFVRRFERELNDAQKSINTFALRDDKALTIHGESYAFHWQYKLYTFLHTHTHKLQIFVTRSCLYQLSFMSQWFVSISFYCCVYLMALLHFIVTQFTMLPL